MKIYIIDVSGKVLNYDIALFDAMQQNTDNEIKMFVPDAKLSIEKVGMIHLLSVIPARYKNSSHALKRMCKAIEGLFNYVIIMVYCFLNKPDIIHFQWFPFLEFCGIESFFLRCIKVIESRKMKIILTIHNVYPHDINEKEKAGYKSRFIKVSSFIDHFIVHTDATKVEVNREFGIDLSSIDIVHHGIFEPDLKMYDIRPSKKHNRLKLIVFGNQTPYKGTDTIIDAMSSLPDFQKKRVELLVMGQIQPDYYKFLREKEHNITVQWMPYFVDDRTLFQNIVDADVILLPYRSISQSGVLLLSLYFNKPIICSDLPAFKETLCGYPDSLFFEAGNAKNLEKVLSGIIENGINNEAVVLAIERIKEKNSWNLSAKKTLEVYKRLLAAL